MYIKQFQDSANKSIKHYNDQLANIRATGAHPSMLNKVMVSSYGAMVPLNQVATVSAPDGRTLIISPFDKGAIKDVIHGVNEANIGLNPVENNGKIMISVPQLTQEKRESFTKHAKEEAEKAKVSIRNVRQDVITKIKNDKTLREDDSKRQQDNLQKEVDKVNKEIETILKAKIDALMKI